MSAPQISVSTLVEVEATRHGWIETEAAHAVVGGIVGMTGGAAVVVVRGALTAPAAASADALRIIGAALAQVERIEVLANGRTAVECAAAIQAAAVEEQRFRTSSPPNSA